MANETYSFEIAAEVTKARKAVESFAKDTQKQLDGIKSSSASTSLATGFLAAAEIAKAAFNVISGVIQSTIAESLEAEKANIQLANSMKLVGDFTQGAFNAFDDYATQLSKVSSASDDQIKSSLALAKSFQLTNSEAKRVVQAATDLSAITGDSLNSSVEKLAKTFNGSLSKELKQLSPELKSLTEEQLRAGAAVDVIGNKFKGSAAVINDSFGGALGNLKKSLLNAGESFGDIFTKSTKFIDLIRSSSSVVDAFAGAIARIGKGGEILAPAEGSLEDIRRKLIEANKDSNLILDDIKKQQRLGQQSKIVDNFQKEAEARIVAQRKANAISEKVQTDYEAKKIELSKLGLSDLQKLEFDSAKTLKLINDARLNGFIKSEAEAQKLRQALAEDTSKKAIELKKAELEKIKNLNSSFVSDPLKAISGAVSSGAQITKDQSIAAGAGFAIQVTKGAEGAKKAVVDSLALAGQAFAGIPAEISGPLLDALSAGPEKIREMVKAFAAQIPEIVKNIALAIPVLIEEISKAVPQIVKGLIESIPEIIDGIVKEIPAVGSALAAQMPSVAIELVSGIVRNIPEIVKGFAEEFLKIPERFVEALIDAIPGGNIMLGGGKSGGGVGGILGGITGAIGNVIGGIGDIFGFADGGRIANAPRLSNDAVIARIGAGEQILGKDLSAQLEDFLAGQNQPQQLTVNLVVGQQQLARAILDLNRGGFRTAT